MDGVTRPVYIDQAGKQHVVDGDGGRVGGVWVPPPEGRGDAPPGDERGGP